VLNLINYNHIALLKYIYTHTRTTKDFIVTIIDFAH